MRQGVNLTDLMIVFIFALFSYFITQSWVHPLADTFFTLSWVAVTIYLIATITGAMSNLILRTPTWTITGLISLFIWNIVALIPISSSTSQDFAETSILIQLFGLDIANFLTNVWVVGFVETIVLVGFVTVFLLKQTKPNSPREIPAFNGKKDKPKGSIFFLIMIFAGLFGAVIHYNIALQLHDAGQLDFGFFLLHQLLSFLIFTFIAFTPLGLAGSISSHMVKNILALAVILPEMWILTFGLFIFLDVISIVTAKKEKRTTILQKVGLEV